MGRSNLNRRRFLRRLAQGSLAGAATVPFLKSFGASAQREATPKLVVYCSGTGALVGPRGGADYEGWLPASMHGGEGYMEAPVPSVLPETLLPFESVKEHLLSIDGLRGSEGVVGHMNTPLMLSGGAIHNNVGARPSGSGDFRSDTRSVDQIVAERLGSRVFGMSYRIEGYQGGEGYISHTGPGVAYTPHQNAHDAFDAVFSAGSTDDGFARRRQSVLDAIGRDARSLRDRLPAADRARLEQHLDSVSRLERDLAEGARPACGVGTRPPEFDSRNNAEVPRLMRSYADTMVQALACGYSQVGFIQSGNLEGALFPLWEEFFSNRISASEHGIAHTFAGVEGAPDISRPDAVRLMIEFQHFHNTMVAELVDRLANTTDVDGDPMIRNTILLQIRPMGENHDARHLLWNIFGGQNLGIRTGRFVRLDSRSGRQPYVNDLLTAIAQAMGVELDQIGRAEQNRSPLDLG